MERIFYYNFYKIERDNKRWGILISAILHALLLLLILIKIFPMETDVPIVEKKEIIVELQMTPKEKEPQFGTGGGSSAGPESEQPKEGGSKGSEAAPALEELEKQPSKMEVIKPTPLPTTANSKPILSAPETQVVKVEAPKVEPRPIPSRPTTVIEPTNTKTSPPVVTAPTSVVVTNPKPTPASGHGNGGSASTGDNDSPGGSGGSGAGSGTGNGSGGAVTGNGPGGGGNFGNGVGTGSGDGAGVNFDVTGVLSRPIVKRANVGDLAGDNVQTLVFNLCVDREGTVTYNNINMIKTKVTDRKFLNEAYKRVSAMKFQKSPNAPKKECGTYTLKILATEYK